MSSATSPFARTLRAHPPTPIPVHSGAPPRIPMLVAPIPTPCIHVRVAPSSPPRRDARRAAPPARRREALSPGIVLYAVAFWSASLFSLALVIRFGAVGAASGSALLALVSTPAYVWSKLGG